MAARIAYVAGSTSGTRGSVAAAAPTACGCPDPAAGPFAQLHNLLADTLAGLEDCSAALGRALSGGAEAYALTDAA